MKLYFRNSHNQERLIAECETIQEVNSAINQFLAEHNYKSYYTRIWCEPEGTKTPYGIRNESRFIYDVGSWSEFFELEVTNEEIGTLPDNMRNLIVQPQNPNHQTENNINRTLKQKQPHQPNKNRRADKRVLVE